MEFTHSLRCKWSVRVSFSFMCVGQSETGVYFPFCTFDYVSQSSLECTPNHLVREYLCSLVPRSSRELSFNVYSPINNRLARSPAGRRQQSRCALRRSLHWNGCNLIRRGCCCSQSSHALLKEWCGFRVCNQLTTGGRQFVPKISGMHNTIHWEIEFECTTIRLSLACIVQMCLLF